LISPPQFVTTDLSSLMLGSLPPAALQIPFALCQSATQIPPDFSLPPFLVHALRAGLIHLLLGLVVVLLLVCMSQMLLISVLLKPLSMSFITSALEQLA